MAKVRLEGFREWEGTVEGTHMHTVKFHLSEPFVDEGCAGRETSQQSVPYDKLSVVFGSKITLDEVVCYVWENCHKEIEVFYNKKGKISEIILPDLDKAKKPA